MLSGLLGSQSILGIVTAIPPLVASAIEGNEHMKQHGARPSGASAWRAAAVMTGLGLAVNILLFGLSYLSSRAAAPDLAPLVSDILPMAALITAAQFGFNRLALRVIPQPAKG